MAPTLSVALSQDSKSGQIASSSSSSSDSQAPFAAFAASVAAFASSASESPTRPESSATSAPFTAFDDMSTTLSVSEIQVKVYLKEGKPAFTMRWHELIEERWQIILGTALASDHSGMIGPIEAIVIDQDPTNGVMPDRTAMQGCAGRYTSFAEFSAAVGDIIREMVAKKGAGSDGHDSYVVVRKDQQPERSREAAPIRIVLRQL
jgi:hypothetical protein